MLQSLMSLRKEIINFLPEIFRFFLSNSYKEIKKKINCAGVGKSGNAAKLKPLYPKGCRGSNTFRSNFAKVHKKYYFFGTKLNFVQLWFDQNEATLKGFHFVQSLR